MSVGRRPGVIAARGAILGLVLVAALSLLSPFAAGGAATATQPKVRTSLTAIWNDVMCVSCHEPLAVAQSEQAVEERQYIQRLVVHGYTKAQILKNLVAQYGEGVLGKPPAHGFNLTVYVLPPALLVIGLAFLAFTLPKWRSRARASAAQPYAPGTELSSDDAHRLEQDLARFD